MLRTARTSACVRVLRPTYANESTDGRRILLREPSPARQLILTIVVTGCRLNAVILTCVANALYDYASHDDGRLTMRSTSEVDAAHWLRRAGVLPTKGRDQLRRSYTASLAGTSHEDKQIQNE